MEEFLKPVLMFGVSIVGSAVQGAIIKHKTNLPNDTIPTQTNATWGTVGIAAGGMDGDPMVMIAGFAGATVASIGHKLIGKLFG